jgi:ubiquinone/menaquinone biosynthesis C-methylase UbiE
VAGDAAPVPGTDRTVLRTAAYADVAKLDDRRNIYTYRRPEFDLTESVLDQLSPAPGARVLDVGCGPGSYLAALAARDPSLVTTGVDLSTGMLGAARRAGVPAVAVSDATALPFATDSFDGAMANHMLYHVEHIDRAVFELRRVVRTGGMLLAVTNALVHFAEFDALLAEVSGRDGWWRPSHRFTLDNGREFLEPAFDRVDLVEFHGELHVPDAEPVIRFARSMRDLSGQGYDDRTWEALMQAFEQRVVEVITTDGAFFTRTHTGVFVCR